MFYIAMLATIVSGGLAFLLMFRRPENIVSILAALTVVFGLIPAALIATGSNFNFYSYRSFLQSSAFLFAPENTTPALLMFSLLTLALCAGGFWGLSARKEIRAPERPSRPTSVKAFLVIASLLMTTWTIMLGREWLASGLSLLDFFTPAVRADRLSYTPGFLYATMMTIPLALMIASRWLPYWRNQLFVFFLIAAVLTCFTTHQRREVVTVILAAASILMIRSPTIRRIDVGTAMRKARRVIIIGLGVGLAAVPIFWYARVFFTSLARGRVVDVFAIRGVEEIIFGSPATAFGAFVLIHNKISQFGAEPQEFIQRILAIPIPRFLWPEKPTDLDSVLQDSYGLFENPSVFWIGDLYNAFGIFAVFASGLFGYIAARSHDADINSASLFRQARAVAVLCLCIVLFKNGFSIFIMRWLVLMVLLALIWYASGYRRARQQTYP